MEIIPAILPRDFNEIEEKTSLVKGLSRIVQIDICDGRFTPSVTWPYKKKDENFEAIIREERGMPLWEDIDYEFDLMIKDPTEHEVRQWVSAGAKKLTFHVESFSDINTLAPIVAILDGMVDIGLAINIQTDVSSLFDLLEKYKGKISYIQLMGITKIGFQGQAFDDRVLGKIKEIKDKYSDMVVQVDGGVSFATASLLKDAGADILIVGSALFNLSSMPEDVVDTYRNFKHI